MNRENYQRVKAVFNEAIEKRPEQRRAFVKGKCGTDDALRQAVEELLENCQSEFLEQLIVKNLIDSAAENKTNVDKTNVGRAGDLQTTVKIEKTTAPPEQTEKSPKPNGATLFAESNEISQISPDEQTLCPNHWRFALVCLLFIFLLGWHTINFVAVFSQTSSFPEFLTNSNKDNICCSIAKLPLNFNGREFWRPGCASPV